MTNSLLNRTGVLVATNKSGDKVNEGDVVILDTGTGKSFTTTSTAGYKDSVIGVVLEPDGIEDDATGKIGVAITVPKVNLTVDAALGDFIRTGTTLGLATPHSTPIQEGDFGQVLEIGGTPAAVLFGFPIQATGVSSLSPTKQVWDPDAPPASPSSLDDEFDDASLDSKWTELDFGSVLTVSESSTYSHLLLTSLPGSGNKVAGLSQTLPAGDFTINTKVDLRGISASSHEAGIALWQNQTSGSDIMTVSARRDNSRNTHVYIDFFTDYANNVIGSAHYVTPLTSPHPLYLRLRRNGTDYVVDWSTDGISWDSFGTAYNPGFTPGFCGVFANNTPATITRNSSIHFFRYTGSDVGALGILAGQLRGIYE